MRFLTRADRQEVGQGSVHGGQAHLLTITAKVVATSVDVLLTASLHGDADGAYRLLGTATGRASNTVTATAMSALLLLSAPRTISQAVGMLTAP